MFRLRPRTSDYAQHDTYRHFVGMGLAPSALNILHYAFTKPSLCKGGCRAKRDGRIVVWYNLIVRMWLQSPTPTTRKNRKSLFSVILSEAEESQNKFRLTRDVSTPSSNFGLRSTWHISSFCRDGACSIRSKRRLYYAFTKPSLCKGGCRAKRDGRIVFV